MITSHEANAVLLALAASNSACAGSALQTCARSAFAGPVTAVAYAPRAMKTAFARPKGPVEIHDANSGAVETCIVGSSSATALAFSPDESRLAFVETDGTVAVAEVSGGRPMTLAVEPDPPVAIAWHPQSALVAAAFDDGSVAVYDPLQRRTMRARLDAGLTSIAFTPDGTRLVSAGLRLAFWTLPRFEKNAELPLPARPTELVFDPRGQVLALACHHQLLLWSRLTGDLRTILFHESRSGFVGVRFDPGGQNLAAFTRDGLFIGSMPFSSLRRVRKGLPAQLADIRLLDNEAMLVIEGSRAPSAR